MDPPPLPISLRIGVLYSGDESASLMTFINDHIQSCKLNCDDQTCVYFKWFYNHNKTCKQQNSCSSCSKLKKWVGLHIGHCHTPSQCPLDHLCGDMKKMRLKDSFMERDNFVEDFLNLSHSGSSPHGRDRIHSTWNGTNSHGTQYGSGTNSPSTQYENGTNSPSTQCGNGTSSPGTQYGSGKSYANQYGNGTHSHGNQYGNGIDSYIPQYWNSYATRYENGTGTSQIENETDPTLVDHRNGLPSLSANGLSAPSYGAGLNHTSNNLRGSPSLSPPPVPPRGRSLPSTASHGTATSSQDTTTPPRSDLTFPQGTFTSPPRPSLHPPREDIPYGSSQLTDLYPPKPVQLPSPSRNMPSLPSLPSSSFSTSFGHLNKSDLIEGPVSFLRRSSNSSTASVHLREKVRLTEETIQEINQQYFGGGGMEGGEGGGMGKSLEERNMSLKQQRDFIQMLNANFRKFNEDEIQSQSEFTRQPSCGDAALSRLDSLLSSGSGSFSSSSPESSLRSNQDSVMGSNSRNSAQAGRRRLRSSTHRLEKMYNVSSLDGPPPAPGSPPVQRHRSSVQRQHATSPTPGYSPVQRHTSPAYDASPPVHHPVQRQMSEGIRKYVRGLGKSLTRTSNGSPIMSRSPRTLSDEEEGEQEGEVNVSAISRQRTEEDDQLHYPTQRSESVSDGASDKFLLARLSISKQNFEKLREANILYNHTRSTKSSHAHPHHTHRHTHHHTHQHHAKRNSYEIESEISSTPSLSSNCSSSSGTSSQCSSMGSDTGDSVGGLGGTNGKIMKDPSIQINDNHNVPTRLDILDCTPYMDNHTPSTVCCGSSNDFSLTSSKSSSTPVASHDPAPSSHDPTSLPHDHTPLISAPPSHFPEKTNSEQLYCHNNGGYCGHDQTQEILDPHIFASLTDSEEGSGSFSASETYHAHTGSYLDDSDMDTGFDKGHSPPHRSMVTKEEMERIYSVIDNVKEQYKDDIAVMKTRGRPINQKAPEGYKKEREDKVAGSVLAWDKESDGYNETSQFSELEAQYYQGMMVPVDERKVAEEEVNHREHLREYLLGQFRRKQVYREGVHWNRQTKLGRGGQGTCFSILDRETNLSLALKEECENDKAMDEAYVCLKFAHEMNVSRNIVEYFGAALLPHFHVRTVQLFMEIMPTCMQAYLFKNGPLLMADVHHFSFQLFDALEYLHNREGIIHCDIKPANLLLDYTAQRMKLADFGAARLLEEKRKSNDSDLGAGTLAYNPPEHYSQQQCSFALDSWQAGCCVLAMATGRRPWRHLFMDPSPGPLVDKSLINKLKREYSVLIGNETNGHMLPAFLDTTITKLLYGCINSDPTMRLTAIESQQLLAFSEELNEQQELTVSDAIGYPSATPPILQSYSCSTASPRIDMFLGSFYEQTPINGNNHTLYPGWVGSVEHFTGMTYEDLYHVIFNSSIFPVLRHLGYMDIALCGSSPQELFVATNPSQSPSPPPFIPVNRRLLVDTSKPVVLYRPS